MVQLGTKFHWRRDVIVKHFKMKKNGLHSIQLLVYMYHSLLKECPWAEHLVGAILSVLAFN